MHNFATASQRFYHSHWFVLFAARHLCACPHALAAPPLPNIPAGPRLVAGLLPYSLTTNAVFCLEHSAWSPSSLLSLHHGARPLTRLSLRSTPRSRRGCYRNNLYLRPGSDHLCVIRSKGADVVVFYLSDAAISPAAVELRVMLCFSCRLHRQVPRWGYLGGFRNYHVTHPRCRPSRCVLLPIIMTRAVILPVHTSHLDAVVMALSSSCRNPRLGRCHNARPRRRRNPPVCRRNAGLGYRSSRLMLS